MFHVLQIIYDLRAVVYRQYTCFGYTETGFDSRQPDMKIIMSPFLMDS